VGDCACVCALLNIMPILVWHRPTSSRPRVCTATYFRFVLIGAVYCLHSHQTNYDVGTKQALNRPKSLQHGHKYANLNVGREGAVGIATRFGLDGPGIVSR
jgi:hypothetical protein